MIYLDFWISLFLGNQHDRFERQIIIGLFRALEMLMGGRYAKIADDTPLTWAFNICISSIIKNGVIKKLSRGQKYLTITQGLIVI